MQHFRDYIGNETTVVTEILQKTTQETEVTYKNSETIFFKLQSLERISSFYRNCGAASLGELTWKFGFIKQVDNLPYEFLPWKIWKLPIEELWADIGFYEGVTTHNSLLALTKG